MGLGVALIALSALAAVWLFGSLGKTTQVVSVVATIERGQTITASDLAAAEVPQGPTGLKTIPIDDLDKYVGQVATTTILPGTLLTPAAATDALHPAEGHSIVGLSLSAAQMPSEPLVAGDHVRIVDTPVNQGDPPAESPPAISAVISSITTSDATSATTIVNLDVDKAKATDLAARAATGRIALVLDGS